jgi:hypothetical protein
MRRDDLNQLVRLVRELEAQRVTRTELEAAAARVDSELPWINNMKWIGAFLLHFVLEARALKREQTMNPKPATDQSVHVVLRLTPSQQMALADLIVHYLTWPEAIHEFIDVGQGAVTTSGQLLTLALWGEIDERPAKVPT